MTSSNVIAEEAQPYPVNSAATDAHSLAWYGTKRLRWTTGQVGPPGTVARDLPNTFTASIIAYGAHDLLTAFVTPSLFRRDLLQIGHVVFILSSTLFGRPVYGPTSSELASETTITQEIDDPIFGRDFVTALRPALVQINKLSDLPAGWDSYDASSVDAENRLQATTFLRVLYEKSHELPIPEVFASSSGGVTFRWTTSTKEIEAEIDSGSVRYFIERHIGMPQRRHGVLSVRDVDRLAALILAELA